MADMHQEGIITTLHDLRRGVYAREAYLQCLEKRLQRHVKHARATLLLPCHVKELAHGEVLDRILRELSRASYLHRIVVALNGTHDRDDFRRARAVFGRRLRELGDVLRIVWVESPGVRAVLRPLEAEGLVTTDQAGKGWAVWVACGYVAAEAQTQVIALHDLDVITYERILLARLLEPILNPENHVHFVKGFYTRVSPESRELKGRVMRLFVSPLLKAMIYTCRERNLIELERFFRYHHAYRYPLAGEFALKTSLAQDIRVPNDWGLEVSILSEIHDHLQPRNIVQTDLLIDYEHAHKSLEGLNQMMYDIARAMLRRMQAGGFPIHPAHIKALAARFSRQAREDIRRYGEDASTNCLPYNRHEEELIVEQAHRQLIKAGEALARDDGDEEPFLPSWNRVIASNPEIYARLYQAVEEDQEV